MAPILLHAANDWPTALSTKPPAPNSPHQSPNERAENAGIPRGRHPGRASPLDPLENGIGRGRSVAERVAMVSKGRRARLQESPREGPESGQKPS